MDASSLDEDERGTLAAANPAMTLPVLVDETPTGEDAAISPAEAAIEYLEELQPDPALLPKTAAGRAEVRRIMAWFFDKFQREAGAGLGVGGGRGFDQRREALVALKWHLDYTDWLLERRAWIAGDRFTAADLVAAAHFSVVDYAGEIPWKEFPETANWYRRVKSRPSMRAILADEHPRRPPAPHYRVLDF